MGDDVDDDGVEVEHNVDCSAEERGVERARNVSAAGPAVDGRVKLSVDDVHFDGGPGLVLAHGGHGAGVVAGVAAVRAADEEATQDVLGFHLRPHAATTKNC